MVDTPRKTFPELQALTAPVVDSDVLAVYRSPGPAKRTTATVFSDYIKAFYSASGGSALVGFLQSGTSAVARTVQAKNRDTLDVRDFGVTTSGDNGAAIQAALTEAASSGKELLWPGGSYTTSIALACNAVKIRFTAPVTLTYSSATHIATVFEITMAGVDTALLGKFHVVGNNKANIGLKILNNNATRADLFLGDLKASSCKMVTAGPSGGAGGIAIRGNIDNLFASSLTAETIGRDAGTGSPGNNCTSGIEIGTTGGYGVRNIRVDTYVAKDITTLDAPGVAACVDVDGVLIQQIDEDDSAFSFEQIIVRNAQGRGLKAQVFKNLRAGSISIFRNIEGTTGGSTDVAFQYGEGVSPQINVRYTGLADTIHGRGTTVLSAYTATTRSSGYGVIAFDNLTVRDETTGGTANIGVLFDVDKSVADTTTVTASITNAKLIGRNANHLVGLGNTGGTGYGAANIVVSGFLGALAVGLFSSSSTKTSSFRAIVSGVVNTGSEVPAITSGVSLGNTFGRLVDGGGNVGIKKQTGLSDTPGLYNEAFSLGGYTNNSEVIGDAILYAGLNANGATIDLPAFGAVPGSARFWAGSPDYGAVGEFTTPPSSNTITTVQASSGLTVGSGGVDPGGLDLSLWKTSSGTRLTVKNASGSSRYFILKTLG
jgi:hypothetical protein